MATLSSLKCVLREKATAISAASTPKEHLSEKQYGAGLEILVQGPGWITYQEFIIPQLSQLVAPLLSPGKRISVLEVGPGPRSVLGYLPDHLRRGIRRYAAFEPNTLFATRLEESLGYTSETESPLPCLEDIPNIHRTSFELDGTLECGTSHGTSNDDDKFDVVLFCHSMYGMKPKHKFIERALEMLAERPEGGIVVVFHRDGTLHLDGLVCHRTSSFHTGIVSAADEDDVLDTFAPFVAGFVTQDLEVDHAITAEWRKVCRAMGRREETHPNYLLFAAPEVMVSFTRNATALPELTAQVPLAKEDRKVKSWEARLNNPASIVRPTAIRHIQQCVRWALKHRLSLTVIGGGHSGHCLMPNVVSIDMGAFDKVHILTTGRDEDGGEVGLDSGFLVVAEAGCKTGDIIQKAMAVGVTVPLGARPSVGAGLWLQGGIGHLARLHGLACDAVVGAIVVSVSSGQILCVGHVPAQLRPASAVRPENEVDLLWAIRGAGTNFGVVVSLTFEAYTAPTYSVSNWILPLRDSSEAQLRLGEFESTAGCQLPRNCSADAYLYWNNNQLHLGVTMFESSTTGFTAHPFTPTPPPGGNDLGLEKHFSVVNGVELFEAEMYVSGMHGGHGGGKTSSFKRCLFLKDIKHMNVANILVDAIQNRPSPFSYLHLLQGGGAVSDVEADKTAFGCRDWDFACVITGVWQRDQDGTEAARAAVSWVYSVAEELLPLSSGVYGADLGPDPRDAVLATKAFGPNRHRLARLKQSLDPCNILAYACPVPEIPKEQRLIILVTGESCAGKDYCADVWASLFTNCDHKLMARAVSISDVTKQEYAAATGTDLNRLLSDRSYKEHHRPALTAFFQDQVQRRPRLPEEHFLNVVNSARDVNVLLITGMREHAPVAALSYLLPESRILDVRVRASEETRQVRQRCHSRNGVGGTSYDNERNKESNNSRSSLTAPNYRPSLIFENEMPGSEAAETFAKDYLLPFFHGDLQRLADMVRSVSDFPRHGIDFRHVLDISQRRGGLTLCASLLQSHFAGDWAKVDAVACCEAGGFVYASALAARVGLPLALARESGKLPPPTVSVAKDPSYISSPASHDSGATRIEMNRDVLPAGATVVVVDDVLATGKTLCAMLQLLVQAGVRAEDVSVMTVAEFPVHRGRQLLHQRGFGGVNIQTLLVFGGI